MYVLCAHRSWADVARQSLQRTAEARLAQLWCGVRSEIGFSARREAPSSRSCVVRCRDENSNRSPIRALCRAPRERHEKRDVPDV